MTACAFLHCMLGQEIAQLLQQSNCTASSAEQEPVSGSVLTSPAAVLQENASSSNA